MKDPVLLPIILRALPTLLAREVLYGGVGIDKNLDIEDKMNKLRGIPGRVLMSKVHYGHFTKVYNRRKRHHPEYLDNLGYWRLRICASNAIKARRWCRSNLKEGSYINSVVDFWFANERDYIFFAMKWGEGQ
jgi:hypothetical protein